MSDFYELRGMGEQAPYVRSQTVDLGYEGGRGRGPSLSRERPWASYDNPVMEGDEDPHSRSRSNSRPSSRAYSYGRDADFNGPPAEYGEGVGERSVGREINHFRHHSTFVKPNEDVEDRRRVYANDPRNSMGSRHQSYSEDQGRGQANVGYEEPQEDSWMPPPDEEQHEPYRQSGMSYSFSRPREEQPQQDYRRSKSADLADEDGGRLGYSYSHPSKSVDYEADRPYERTDRRCKSTDLPDEDGGRFGYSYSHPSKSVDYEADHPYERTDRASYVDEDIFPPDFGSHSTSRDKRRSQSSLGYLSEDYRMTNMEANREGTGTWGREPRYDSIPYDRPRSVESPQQIHVATSVSGKPSVRSKISSLVHRKKNKDHEDKPDHGSNDKAAVSKTCVDSEGNMVNLTENRGTYDNKVQYLLALIGYAVGLGNVWRFPYLVQKNGGGVFLIPYFICLAFLGLPMLIIELGLGQRMQRGPWHLWYKVSPWVTGIGVCQFAATLFSACYYNTIISWCAYYMFNSFEYPLPWTYCPQNYTDYNQTYVVPTECLRSSPTNYFWYRTFHNMATSLDTNTGISWRLLICLMFSWLLVCLCTIRGLKSSGKVVYFTATFPYLVLTIFLIKGFTLPGFSYGLVHLFKPDWTKLIDGEVWMEAASQIFFSLSLSSGGMLAMSSYMPINNNFYKDAVIVSVVNCATSLYAGVVIFSLVGYKAYFNYNLCLEEQNTQLMQSVGRTTNVPGFGETTELLTVNEFGEMVTFIGQMPSILNCSMDTFLSKSVSGTGLAFISISEAIITFGPSAPFWSFMFYFMLITLGLDSMFGTMEMLLTTLHDIKVFERFSVEVRTIAVSLTLAIIAIIFSTGIGEYMIQIFDEYVATLPLFVIATFEVITVAWIYGMKNFSYDFQLMIGHRPNFYWMLCWTYIAPVLMIGIFVFAVVSKLINGITYSAWDSELAVQVDLAHVPWSKFLCAFLTLVCTIWLPVLALLNLAKLLRWETDDLYFPEAELRKHHGLDERKEELPALSRKLFCL